LYYLWWCTIYKSQIKSSFCTLGPGVYYGDIDTSGKLGPYSVTCKQMLMRYPKDSDERGVNTPFSMVLTEFHTLLLFSDRCI
jgi:hypothetical protein